MQRVNILPPVNNGIIKKNQKKQKMQVIEKMFPVYAYDFKTVQPCGKKKQNNQAFYAESGIF